MIEERVTDPLAISKTLFKEEVIKEVQLVALLRALTLKGAIDLIHREAADHILKGAIDLIHREVTDRILKGAIDLIHREVADHIPKAVDHSLHAKHLILNLRTCLHDKLL